LINADPLHLRRLFFNLIDNAIKFSPDKSRIVIVVAAETQHVRVSIKDQGRGITPKDAAKIFDLFYSADSVSGGNGLGLSIAQAIAKAHDGMITVSNNSQRGAEFIVILPVA
jgi:signal transduction histidine kinase